MFYSDDLWFGPSSHANRKQVTVLVDPQDLKRYYMDIALLPQLEE